ncbi:MAG: GTP cyclohydrolase [Oscillibacter sp.]|nr:GTP cyclohydrolase [Oscillibacter sp.]
MFIFSLTYVKPLSEVERLLPAHIQFLDEHYKKHLFMCSGRKIPRTGGIILCNCADMAEAKAIMEKDPFYKEGIARYDIIEFVPSKSSEAFQTAMSEQTKQQRND